MNWKRTALLGVLCGALAAWLAGAATSTDRPIIDTTVAKPTAVELQGAELAAEIARLRERLHPAVEPQRPARNLFQFSSKAAGPTSPVTASTSVLEEAVRPSPAEPPLKLIGIAEDPGPEGPVRTAIISGFGQTFFVKDGDTIGTRFRVQHLSGESVELSDLVEPATYRLALQ